MGVEGDFGRLAKLTGACTGVPKAIDLTAKELAEVVDREYQAGFRRQASPYGDAWAETVGGGKILFKSGALANPTVKVTGRTLKLRVGAYYGIFHQGGWETGGEMVKFATSTNIKTRKTKFKKKRVGGKGAGPARPIVPAAGEAALWDRSMRAATERIVAEHFKV